MASDWKSELARLEAAQRQLHEHTEKGAMNGNGSGRLLGNLRAAESGDWSPTGNAPGDKPRARHHEAVRVDPVRPPREHAGAVGHGREDDGKRGANGGRASGVSTRGAPTSGQDARKASLLTPKEKAVETVKRALTYAGFDLKGDAGSLSAAEIEKYKPQMATFFKRLGLVFDWCITHSNKEKSESDIWMFDDAEAETLAIIYLKRASKIGWMAQVARQVEHVENLGDGKDLAEIVGKRLWATGMFYPANGGISLWLKS